MIITVSDVGSAEKSYQQLELTFVVVVKDNLRWSFSLSKGIWY